MKLTTKNLLIGAGVVCLVLWLKNPDRVTPGDVLRSWFP